MERDPSGQLAWLATELEAAEAAGERVWLMGHMPLGSSDALDDQSQYFGKRRVLNCSIGLMIEYQIKSFNVSMLRSLQCSMDIRIMVSLGTNSPF
jgi:hypothetical protein